MTSERNTGSDRPRAALQRAPAAERNLEPILDVLTMRLPGSGRALEVASGTGQHAAAFAGIFPGIEWYPSDADSSARESIKAWREEAGLANLHEPLKIDVTQGGWENAADPPFDAVLAINLVHIAPWAAAEGLLRGAGALLVDNGFLYLYGPFRRDGAHTARSNVEFDGWLKGQNPDWGVRDIGDIAHAGARHGLGLAEVIAMPANNFSVILRKAPA